MTKRRLLMRDAIRAVTVSVESLAKRLDLSTSALRKYRAGDRAVPPALLRTLARVLRRHADRLRQLADHLDREGRTPP